MLFQATNVAHYSVWVLGTLNNDTQPTSWPTSWMLDMKYDQAYHAYEDYYRGFKRAIPPTK